MDEDVSEKQRGDLDVINRSGEHLLNLINDVLDVAKIEAGNQGLELVPCDLTSLVIEVMDMMRERAEAKHIALFVVQPAEFPRYVRADAPKLRQVLINLLDNAVKYTETGSVGLQLEAGPADAAGRLPMTFSVEDTGIGVSREDQARIFEAFVQIGKPDSQRGTGLGLTITRQFVELMGGTIRVESTPGEGSRFCVELSVERAQESDLVARAAHSDRVIGVAHGEPEYRILVIDDERHNRTLLERLLQNAGFHGARGRRRRAGSTDVPPLAAAFHLDGSAYARAGRSPGDATHPRAGRRAGREDRRGHRLCICRPAERDPGGGAGRFGMQTLPAGRCLRLHGASSGCAVSLS